MAYPKGGQILAFMGAALFLISVHTLSPALWKRPGCPAGWVGFIAVVVSPRARPGGRLQIQKLVRIPVAPFSVAEQGSGLIFSLWRLGLRCNWNDPRCGKRIRSAIWVAVIGVYLLGRFVIFGSTAAS
jgi:hypothetical protein